ncbi:MAG: hypothetical protein FWD94_07875 [Treponema sp.]|nr:hypothetical protein [Treponema sp.]
MESTSDWREIKYQETFEAEFQWLEHRRAKDPSCTVEDIEATLRNLFLLQGDGHDGRGDVQETSLSASIAAYELFISNWRAEMERRE